ncbi:cilia- and flagella-associated protein 44 isoform X1 [Pleurodeles waltl]|uniref:cilia- and flagella-associated protein 44 isoform X1 n=1 Tax=Pleurodeles waltl TaxID=8319 RepID=UPI003709833C
MEEEAAAEATAEGAEAPAGEMESGEDNVAEIRPGAESDSHTHDIGGQPDSQMDEGKQSTDLITAVVVESEAENRAEVTPKEESHKHAPGTGGQIDYTQVPDGEQEPDILPDQDKQPDDVITPGEIMESAPETQAELRPEEESNPHTAGTEETPDYPVDQDKEADPDGQGHVSEEDPPEVKREEMSSLRTPGTEGQPDYPHTPGARGQTDNPMDEDKQSSDPDTTVEVESAEESLVELRHAECSDRQSPGTRGEFDNLPVHNKQSADPDPTEADIKDETTENIDQETSGQELNLPEDQDDPTDGSSRPGTSESTQLEQKEGKRVKRRRRSSALQADTTYQTESDEGTSEAEETGSEGEEQEKRKRKRRKKDEELLKKIPESFFYKYDEICPQPYVTPDSGVPTNLLQLVHSFGYNCTKRANLELLDDHTIIYIAGSLVVILNVKTKEHTYLRCCSGGGIGNIAVHYSKHYFAVAEKGQSPKIIIYEYPSLKSYRILRGGTVEAYAFVNFNVSGTLLASVGSSPDYMLTIWNWRHEKIVLRSKAFSQDVYRVTFSTENEEQLTTSGTGHIKFWKMALTFTGLKLQGALGRFGKTGLSDIEGYVELPDGKVVSGSEWGNMLLWEGGLIKVEFCRKGRKPCHAGSINQFVLDEGELISIGSDGYVRVWDFETVDTAETSDDIGIVEMEPINELLVGKHVNLRSMVKVLAPYSHIWFAQDAFGAIWKLDLSFSNITQDPECLFSYHSGKIEGLDASPTTHLVATTALDCSVRIYDILGKCPLVDMKFKQGGTSLIWAPRMVNPKGGMFTVGFEDGVVRLLEVYNPKGLTIVAGRTNTGEAEMRLKQAFKPHVAPVTALAYDRNGELLATGSEDKTVFFFATGDKYEPIGFIRVPGPVRQLQWSPTSHEDSTLLVLCGNGYAVQVAAPSVEAQVPVSTYEIQDLQLRHFRFRSVKSKIQREQELAARAMKKEEKLKARLAWIAEQKERGVELTEEELVEKPEEEPELPPTYIPEEPSPILAGFYSTPSRFWLSLGGYDAGYLYHCQFDLNEDVTEDPSLRQDEPFDVLPIENTEMNPIRKMYFSNNQQLLLCGMENGAVRVYPLEASDPQLDSLHGYWSLGIHDNQYGHIQAICSSYDNQFLVTCGADGNIFSFSILSQEDIEKDMRGKRAKVPSPRLHLEKEKVPEDIEDPNAYSIENAKQKLEYDQMVKEAEEKKASKRQELSVLRSKFSELLMKNKDLPSHMQLERGEFEMDQRIREEMERLTSERIRTVLKELAWEQEKYRIGLHKLQARFRASVEYDTVVVHAIGSSHQVSTYRLLALSEKYHKVRGQLGKKQSTRFDARFKESDIAREARAAEESRSVESKGIREPVGKRLKHQWSGLAAKRADKLEKMIEKADKAKAKILQRKKEWEDLFNQKPSDNYEDPKDVTAIHAASENMGDFRLKTAPNYTVPEHMRMSADRKRHQLAMLEELMHEKKAAMNRWILSLRDLKLATIEEIQALVKDLKGIQSKLDPSKHLPIPAVPQMQPDETPEKRFEYNDEILNKFRLTEEKQLQAPNSSEQQGGFGGFGGSQGQIVTRKDSGSQSQLSFSSTSGTQQSIMTPDLSQATDKEESGFTNLELEIMKVEEIKNMYHQQRIIKKIQQLKTLFDAELRLLRHQKMKLDVQMKMGDLRHITLFEEMLFLKDFEKLEDKLQENVNKRLHEKEEVKWKSKDLQQQLEVKKLAIAKLQEREKALQTTFQASLGENNKFADFLTKVFKKKIKRTKKKVVHGEEDEDEDSDEESDEESGWESDEEDLGSEDEPFDDSVCPDGCDPDLFENTLHLREKRLDIEEAQAEEKKLVDNLKKDHDAMAKKVKGVDASLKVAEAELEAFQREKQQKVNELLVVVLLRLHQVEHVINGEIPKDLSASLVFTNKALEGLQQRIRELQVEKSQQRDLYKEARQRHKQLISDRKEMETKIRTLDDRCRQQMIMKFGRIVDLEILQTLSVNINLEELKISSLEKEIQMDKELKEWQVKIADAKQRMREVTREHTMKLEAMNRLLTDKITLEARLDARQTNVGEEFRGPRRADLEDKERLIELVEVQLLEIDALKEEICLLSRKGGSILPPAQPPLPQSSGTCV